MIFKGGVSSFLFFFFAICILTVDARALTIGNSGKCVDDLGYSTALAAPWGIYTCNGASNQNYTLTAVATGIYTIKNNYSKLCLDDLGYSKTSGSLIGQYTCNGQSNQNWKLNSLGSGKYKLVNSYSGLCADTKGESTASATDLVQNTCNSSSTQVFSINLGGTSGVPASKHVFLVIEENHTFSQVQASMPWLVSESKKYGLANAYHADQPGSLLDYLWLSSGSGETQAPFYCTGGGCQHGISEPTTGVITDNNIFRQLISAGKSWKIYAESIPYAGCVGSACEKNGYVARHNPAIWYADVYNSSTQRAKMVPFTQLATDLANGTVPEYSIIVPNLNNDAHNGTLATADSWLSKNVAPVLTHSFFQSGGDGIMIITFDECDAAVGACNEQVYTAVIGPHVIPGKVSNTTYRHENTLKTIMEALGIGNYPGAAANAIPMSDFFH